MTPERWQEVKLALHEAMQLASDLRPAYLSHVATKDPELRVELDSLLAANEQAGTAFLNTPGAEMAAAGDLCVRDPLTSRRLGLYQVVEEIGAGGMGEVYRAFRADGEYRKEVAIKLVRAGHDSAFVISRFKNERQILASFDHPNIARLLDGGTTDDGVPYLVMELIEGEPIDNYCDSRRLPISDRLKLFLQVCSAVQYAHQRLVIHRDIKPSNILITTEGVPKLLDFGIAKILDPAGVPERLDATLTVLRLLTPEYASPEQVRGESITTASDVYSLGVVLYELLTGRGPYRIASHTAHETSRAVCEFEPARPSIVVRQRNITTDGGSGVGRISSEALSATREGSPEKLSKRLAGDLDNIVRMALRKEPERRYASVEQFAQDIRRHLESLPVIARADTALYRSSKFIGRHKAGVAAALAVAIILLAGMIVTLREARIARANQRRAERRFNDVRRLANSLVFEIHDSIESVPGTTVARQLITERSLEYLDSLAQEAVDDRSLQSELATAYVKVGDVQGQSYSANLGDTAGALASYRKALAIRETLAAADPGNLANRLELAKCYTKVGEILARMGDQSSAVASYRRALLLADSLPTRDAASLDIYNELVLTQTRLGYVLEDMGDLPSALSSHRQAVTAGQEMLAAHPADPLACHDLATAYNNVGDLLAKSGSVREGLEVYRKGLALCDWVSADDPASTQANTRGWEADFIKTGEMLTRLGNRKEAFENYDKAMSIAQRLSAADPQNAQAGSDLADCYESIGDSRLVFGEGTKALESYRQAIAIRERLYAKDGRNADVRADLASSYAQFGQAYAMLASSTKAQDPGREERWREACSAYQKSLALLSQEPNREVSDSWGNSERDIAVQGRAKCDSALLKLHEKR